MASNYIDLPVIGGSGGVSSLNSLTGDLSVAAGTNITVTPSGTNITVANTIGPSVTPNTASTAVERDANGWIEDIDASFAVNFYEDFLGYQPGNDNSQFNGASSGSGAKNGSAGGDALIDNAHPGIIKLQPGTTTTGSAIIFTGGGFIFGAGTAIWECLVYMPTLFDPVTDTGDLWFGFGNTFQANDVAPTTGLWFEWNPGVNSGNWRLGFGTGTSSYVNSSVPLVAATWTKLSIIVNASGTLVTYYINGVSAGTTNSHIPVAASTQACNMFARTTKTAGTTNLTVSIDYMKYRQILTTPR